MRSQRSVSVRRLSHESRNLIDEQPRDLRAPSEFFPRRRAQREILRVRSRRQSFVRSLYAREETDKVKSENKMPLRAHLRNRFEGFGERHRARVGRVATGYDDGGGVRPID